MNRHRLRLETLLVDSFGTAAPDDVDECVCDYPPCICTAGEDCATSR